MTDEMSFILPDLAGNYAVEIRRLDLAQPTKTARIERSSDAVNRARALIQLISLRDRTFQRVINGPKLMGDPVWEMLLELFVLQSKNKPISVSSLCIAANVPPTTALRHLNTLVRNKLCERRPDETDSRRIHVFLTRTGDTLMRTVLGAELDL